MDVSLASILVLRNAGRERATLWVAQVAALEGATTSVVDLEDVPLDDQRASRCSAELWRVRTLPVLLLGDYAPTFAHPGRSLAHVRA